MLHKSVLPVITSWLSRRNRHIASAYCSTLTTDSSPAHQKEAINTAETKGLIEKTGLSKVKKKKKTIEKQLKYIQSILQDKETLDIINYIRKVNPDIIDIIQSMKCTLKKGDTNILHLIDKDTAAKYVSLIKNDLSRNMCYVAELNSGFGILTRELLKAGVPLIHMYEGNQKLHQVLETISAKYPGKLNLISSKHSNLFGITRAFYDDKITDGQYQDSFKAIESKNWEDETYMQVIGATDSKYLFTFIIHSLVFRNGFMYHGRPIFYIAILPSLWHRYNTCTSNSNYKLYTYTKVMFKLMFTCELLGTLNRKAFIPWPKKKRQSTYNVSWPKKKRQSMNNALSIKQDYEQIYVIKLEPKADLYSELSRKDWVTFSYFVKHHLQKRRTRVIPALEKWVPDCGIRLIAKDYTIYTQFGDLTPIQILELFKEFKSWPEYKESYFIGSMNNSLGAHNEMEFLNE
ncbi:dimethyladenosine transferase 2, mitochondrial [Temnothorax curvispinosus]|uniref:Dimethyladenosine transferase 2, mitochondrial n=1 Tax=Temnothorax curvispinosus TaxID=300111 RepID=A0A6J1PIC0_9HYME|nr:dimethyladenosine transferase 2, mitochondrial [Temnothorax curvispinosus]XP_024869010.1 dimethyladenosine transferase 2, mitochondrial [Temnothorax curvispinosus]